MKPTPLFWNGLVEKVSAWQPSIIVPPGRIQKRMLLTGVLLLLVFFSSFSQQRSFLLSIYDSCHVRAPQETIVPFAVAAIGAPIVRIAYIIPSNRTLQPNATAYLQHAIKTGQQWYKEQMEQNGFGAKTFLFETEADGITPLIHIVQVTETDDYLRGDIWGRTLQAATNAGLSVWASGEVWVIMPETHLMAPDGTIAGGVALGASNGTGNSPGVCMIGSNALPLFKPEMITDDTPYDGKILAALGPYPLKQDLSFASFEGNTFSSVTSSNIGALLHEMGHAFGLAHDFRNDNNFHGNLMGNGLRGMRGSLFPQKYPQDVTRLEYAAGLILSVSHYFNKDKIVTSSPVLNYNNPGPVIPQQGLVRLPFEASDADTLSLAQLRYDGNLVAEMVLKGTRMTATFAVPYFTKGATNSYTIALHDKQGNATYTGVQFAVPTGYNQAPIPFVRINPAIPGSNPSITLDASQSQDIDHSVSLVTAAWDVNNDGQFDIESGTSKMAQYSYATPGNYLIRLKLKDSAGGEAISTPVSVKITTVSTPPGGNGTGLRAEYFNNVNVTGAPVVNRVDQQVDFTWNAASPATGINADNFSARWTGQVEAPVTGNYVFSTVSDDGVRLLVNGAQVINNWTDHAPTVNNSVAIPLVGGTKYDIRMEFYDHTLGAVARLLWSYPNQAQQPVPQSRLYPAAPGTGGSGTGLTAAYFNNINLTGTPVVNRVDQQVNFIWNAVSPAVGVNPDNFSVRWTGQVEAPVTGNYVFSTVSDDGVRLWINCTQVINNWTDHAPITNNSVAIPLTGGTKYDIRMEFYDHTLGAVARLLWAYPGQAQQPIPQQRLYPDIIAGGCNGPQCNEPSVTLSSQADVDAFNCVEFAGHLLISGSDIRNLQALSSLKRVGSIAIENNPNLFNLHGLEALEVVTGNVIRSGIGVNISGNKVLADIDALSSLREISQSFLMSINIDGNPMLKNINGLISITTLNAGLSINGNSSLENIDGLRNFTEVKESFNVGQLTISNNASLKNINGLASLKVLRAGRTGGLYIQNNPLLTNIDGLSSLTVINGQIASGLFIENNAGLKNLNGLRSLTSIGWGPSGRISIQNNRSLENVDGLSSIRSLGLISVGSFIMEVVNNPLLRRCCGLFPILSLISPDIRNSLVTMSGNGAGCTIEDVIAGGVCTGSNGSGLTAEYFNNINLTGTSAVRRLDPQVDFTWNAASPATGINADNFSARWTGQVEAPVTGNFVFSTVSDDGVRLWINGVQVINNWTDHAPTVNNSAVIPLTAGTKYDIRMEFYEHTLGAVARLLWAYPGQVQQPIPQSRLYPAAAGGNGTGLNAEYFNNINLTGTPAVNRVDSQVDFTWNAASPVTGINADNFSVRWTGQVQAPVTGNYVFSTVSDDGVRLWINSVQVINNWTDHAPTVNNAAAIALIAGTKYDIRMEFYEHTLGAVARLLWAYPGQTQQPVPQSRLYSAAGLSSTRIASKELPQSAEINSGLDDDRVLVYPNPVNSVLNITIYSDVSGEVRISIQSSVLQDRVEVSANMLEGENHFEIPVHDFRGGLYFLTVNQAGKKVVRKIMVTE